MGERMYRFGRLTWRVIRHQCINARALHLDRLDRPGGFLIACTHLSHVEPMLVSALSKRKIDWMARQEFFKYRWAGWFLRQLDIFSVNRQGPAFDAIRTAVQRVRNGAIVGVFPEGGVAQGSASVLRGGPIKYGVCLISLRTGMPILPVVIVGTDKLTRVAPWLPWRRAHVWVAVGEPIFPQANPRNRREARRLLGEELSGRFKDVFQELVSTTDLDPASVP